MTATRTKKLTELFEGFQTIRRGMMMPKTSQSMTSGMGNITLSQWMVLRLIEQNAEASVKYIAGELGISSSATTQLIDSLVRDGYVLRKERASDRRLVELRLSGKAKKDLGRMQKKIITRLDQVFETLTDAEFAQYVRLNEKIGKKIADTLQTIKK